MSLLRIFFVFFLLPLSLFGKEDPALVLVHGYLGSSWNFMYYKKHLKQDGWDVIAWNYPSASRTIHEHGEDLVKELQKIASLKKGQPISFVAHSMGSLVLRSALCHPDCPMEAKMGKVVLLGPPNQGVIYARKIKNFPIAKRLLGGFSGNELSTLLTFDSIGEFPESTPVLVIAGRLGFNPFIKGQNDGIIAVTETVLSTKHEHTIIFAGHKGILFSKKALAQTRKFLKNQPPIPQLKDKSA